MGRREEKQLRTRSLIFSVASKLFAKHGFNAVTTQAISDEADIAAGTLFRYVSSKTELLLMVFNDKFARAIQQGKDDAAQAPDVRTAILALVEPLVELTNSEPENALVYQRELLFGTSGKFWQEGRELISDFEDAAAKLLLAHADTTTKITREEAQAAAGSHFAVFHLAMTRFREHEKTQGDIQKILTQQIQQILTGALGA